MAGESTAYRHYRRSSSFIGSCFTGSPIYEDEDEDGPNPTPTTTKPPPNKILRFFSMPANKKKKTVPFDADAPETPIEDRKDNNYKSTTKSHRHHRQFSAATTTFCLEEYPKKSCIFHNSSNSCSARTATATSHPERRKNRQSLESESNSVVQKTPKECDAIGSLNRDAGILTVMVILAALVLFGRASAIICMSVLFYLAPRKSESVVSRMGFMKKSPHGSNYECSGEDKRRVVLQGFLERNGKKRSRSLTAPVGTFQFV